MHHVRVQLRRRRVRPTPATIIYYLAHALLIAVGTILIQVGGSVWLAIGTSLIATGGAGAILYLYTASSSGLRERLELVVQYGIVSAFSVRAAQIRDEYHSRLAGAHDAVDILGFGLSDFRRDYMADLPALAARAMVRILVLDTTTEFGSALAAERDREEGQSEGTIADEVDEFVAAYQRLPDVDPGRLHLRRYPCLPLVNIFRIDDDLFWGPYLVGLASGNTTTQLVRRGGPIFEQLTKHFDEVWEVSHKVDRADVE